jgi:hypothetical protein
VDNESKYLKVMPTSRLNDILKVLNTKAPSVVNIDACVPAKESGEMVLKTILHKMPKSVKVFSMRFNNLSSSSIDSLLTWITANDHLETIYLMGCGIDEKNRLQLENGWKKHLENHRTSNMGYTFIRVTSEVVSAALKAELDNA